MALISSNLILQFVVPRLPKDAIQSSSCHKMIDNETHLCYTTFSIIHKV